MKKTLLLSGSLITFLAIGLFLKTRHDSGLSNETKFSFNEINKITAPSHPARVEALTTGETKVSQIKALDDFASEFRNESDSDLFRTIDLIENEEMQNDYFGRLNKGLLTGRDKVVFEQNLLKKRALNKILLERKLTQLEDEVL